MTTPASGSPSLLGRAALAIALMVGFYTLALGISAALLLFPYAMGDTSGGIIGRFNVFSVVTAVLILYAIFPRRDRFKAPGPDLAEARNPRLFELLGRVAEATHQRMPQSVYLVPELNAWVANRGGFLGLGSRRVMGLGLAAFQVLSIPQFAAVLAHEFGHYHHGDVALGPLLYRVRKGIGRTLETLGRRNNIFFYPFNWYAHLFLRVSGAVSRRQELAADALAAGVAGRDALVSGLETIHATAPLFDGYWATEVVPVLASGFRPPIAQGFAKFAQAPRIVAARATALKSALDAEQNPLDTHPPLAQRVAALPATSSAPSLDLPSTGMALELLADIDDAESALLEHLVTHKNRPPMRPVDWDSVGREVWVPAWRRHLEGQAPKLRGIRCADVGAVAADASWLAVRMGLAKRSAVATDAHRQEAAGLFGAALTLLLLDRGATLVCEPGEDPVVRLDTIELRPFVVCSELASGEMVPSEWLARCERLGLQDADLSMAVP